ncbi:UNVERIFIED_CONTAM: hypothetical protein FKN15_037510 [Acipenser sinensis]
MSSTERLRTEPGHSRWIECQRKQMKSNTVRETLLPAGPRRAAAVWCEPSGARCTVGLSHRSDSYRKCARLRVPLQGTDRPGGTGRNS